MDSKTMKRLLALFAASSLSVAGDPIPKVELMEGRSLEKVEIVEMSAKGIRVKHARGTQMVKFSDLTPDGAKALGALDLSGPPSANEEERLPRIRKLLTSPPMKEAQETESQFKKRLNSNVEQLESEARWAWDVRKKSLNLAAEQEKEGIDSAKATAVAAYETGIAIACEIGKIRAEALAKGK